MWYVGLDIHAQTTVVSIRSGKGVVVRREVVPTTAAALRRALRGIRGRVLIACEAGPLAAWIKRVLETQLREIVACDRRRTQLVARGGPKADKVDADRLSDCLRLGRVHAVYIPAGADLQLRQFAKHYVRMRRDRAKVIQRLRALFVESGVRIGRDRSASQRVPVRRLSGAASKAVARAYLRQIQSLSELVTEARTLFISAAEEYPAYHVLQSIPFIGEIRAAMLIAIVGNPARFTSRRKFWAYGGLAVVQKTSAEHRVEDGKVIRNEKTQGVRLNKSAQPTLKKLLRDVALHASSVGRSPFRELYNEQIAKGRRPSLARLILARKIAAVVLGVWRSGEQFDPQKLNIRSKTSGRASREKLSRRRTYVAKATALTICRPEESTLISATPSTG